MEQLAAMDGVEVFSSDANFILFRVAGKAVALFEYLKNNQVLIKNLHQPDSALQDCLRVTVGTVQECETFLALTKEFLS